MSSLRSDIFNTIFTKILVSKEVYPKDGLDEKAKNSLNRLLSAITFICSDHAQNKSIKDRMQNLLNIFTKYQTPAEYYFGWFKDQKNNVPENLVKELLALRKAVFALLKSPNIVDDPELGHFTDLIKSLNPND